MPASTPYFRAETLLIAFVAIVGLLHPFQYWTVFSGDAEIHLIYANNLLRGHPLQFNLNEANSGETSMGFMLVDALIMWLVGPAATPVAVKALCLASLYLSAFATWLVAGQLGVKRPWRELGALFTLWLPGSVYSALLGTENVLFAALSLFFVYFIISAHWYDEKRAPTLTQDVVAGLIAGVLFWLRPEAAPLALILLIMRIVGTVWFKRPIVRDLVQLIAFGLVFVVAILAYVGIFWRYAGEMPYGAGQARRLLSMYSDSFWIGKIPVNGKVLIRILSYFSIVVPALAAVALALTSHSRDREVRLKTLTLAAVFFAFMGAYVFNVLPAVHFARYSVFVWPYGLILAALGLQTAVQSPWLKPQVATGLIAVLGVAFLGNISLETFLRADMGRNAAGAESTLVQVEKAPERREAASLKLAEALGLPPTAPATLGYQEVQTRYEYADNFAIRSLDGITDSRLLRYFCNGWIDHDGYLIDTKVDYLMEFPNYNSDRSAWSLKQLASLGVGQSVVRPGITYIKIRPDIVKIERTTDNAANRPGGICAAEAK